MGPIIHYVSWKRKKKKKSEDFELGVVTLISTTKGSIRIRVNSIMWTSNLLEDLFPWELVVNLKEFFFPNRVFSF